MNNVVLDIALGTTISRVFFVRNLGTRSAGQIHRIRASTNKGNVGLDHVINRVNKLSITAKFLTKDAKTCVQSILSRRKIARSFIRIPNRAHVGLDIRDNSNPPAAFGRQKPRVSTRT